MEKKRAHVITAWCKRRLKDRVGECIDRIDPFPGRMVVELFQMIEIMIEADGFIVPTPKVDDHALLSRQLVHDAGQARHRGKVGRDLDEEEGDIDAIDIGREREAGQLGIAGNRRRRRHGRVCGPTRHTCGWSRRCASTGRPLRQGVFSLRFPARTGARRAERLLVIAPPNASLPTDLPRKRFSAPSRGLHERSGCPPVRGAVHPAGLERSSLRDRSAAIHARR